MTLGPTRDEIHQEFLRAEKSLHAAEILLRDNCLEDAVSRAYYAILHAARAGLLASLPRRLRCEVRSRTRACPEAYHGRE